MDQHDTHDENKLQSVADLEVSSEQAEEIQAGIKLEPVLISNFQTGGSGH